MNFKLVPHFTFQNEEECADNKRTVFSIVDAVLMNSNIQLGP